MAVKAKSKKNKKSVKAKSQVELLIPTNKLGRPTVITLQVLVKLEQAFAWEATVEEACAFAGVSRDTYYEYLKKNPSFSDRVEELRLNPVLKARKAVMDKVGDSYQNAMDFLKRKRKDEYGDAPTAIVPVQVNITEDREKYK